MLCVPCHVSHVPRDPATRVRHEVGRRRLGPREKPAEDGAMRSMASEPEVILLG
jgi:hypothetical protein